MKNISIYSRIQLAQMGYTMFLADLSPKLIEEAKEIIKEKLKIYNIINSRFSVIEVVEVLIDNNKRPRKYWSDLKQKLILEGFIEVSEKIGQLKMMAKDGKMRLTDVADTKTLLRIIQTIPSPKAEPFKRWLAQVGSERLDEIVNPELAINRAKETFILIISHIDSVLI